MSDTTVVYATADAAATAFPWLLLAIASIGVAVMCVGLGWLAHWADRRWPVNRYKQEPEQ